MQRSSSGHFAIFSAAIKSIGWSRSDRFTPSLQTRRFMYEPQAGITCTPVRRFYCAERCVVRILLDPHALRLVLDRRSLFFPFILSMDKSLSLWHVACRIYFFWIVQKLVCPSDLR